MYIVLDFFSLFYLIIFIGNLWRIAFVPSFGGAFDKYVWDLCSFCVCVCVEIWKVLSWKFKKVIETTYTMSDKYMATYVA